MTSRFTLLACAAGLIWAGCSSPAEDGDIPPAPSGPPPGGFGPVASAGTGGAPAGGTGGAPSTTAGTGGTANTTAGTGGAPAGGTGGAAGTGGAPSTIPTGMGLAITHGIDGWVAGTSNGVGIQGAFYAFGDETAGGDTTVEVGDFAASQTSACVSGVASQVLEEAYETYWGGGIGLNLADPGGGGAAGPWTQGTVRGFSFTVTGPTIPANIRFNATLADGSAYCADAITTTGATTIQLGSLTFQCYNAGGAVLPATTALESIQWQVVTNTMATTPFDFCVENLTAVTTP